VRHKSECEQLGFTLKAVYSVSISGKLFREDLDRDFTLQLQITRAIYLAHAALAEESGDFMRSELRANGQSHVRFKFPILMVVPQIEKNNTRRRLGVRIAMERHDALRLALVGNLKILAGQITDNLIVVVKRDNNLRLYVCLSAETLRDSRPQIER
jgi:hypothetical protein